MSDSLIVLGVGNVLSSDDGAGPYLAHILAEKGIKAYDCGTAPENFTGIVRKAEPKLLIIVDASLMNLEPGNIRRIPLDRIEDVAVGTHMLPLSTVAEFMSASAEKIVIIGIEPQTLEYGDSLSPIVLASTLSLIEIIVSGKIEELPLL